MNNFFQIINTKIIFRLKNYEEAANLRMKSDKKRKRGGGKMNKEL